jgi:hypothetical protein
VFDFLGVAAGVGEGHHATDVVPDDADAAVDAELCEEFAHVLCLCVLVVSARGTVGGAQAAQVGSDDAVTVRGEGRHEVSPGPPCLGPAVQKE